MLSPKWNMWLSRLLPYWLTVIATCWMLAYYYAWNAPRAHERNAATISKARVGREWL